MRRPLLMLAACLTSFSAAHAGGLPTNHLPRFTTFTPEVIVVDFRLHQFGFEAVGTAVDDDLQDTVSFLLGSPAPFMQFQSFDGNPASFRLYAENLGPQDLGAYGVIVQARDNATFPGTASIPYAVVVIPEPISSTVFTGFCVACFRRSRY